MKDAYVPEDIRERVREASEAYAKAREKLGAVNAWLDEQFGELDEMDSVYSPRAVAGEALVEFIVDGDEPAAFEAAVAEAFALKAADAQGR